MCALILQAELAVQGNLTVVQGAKLIFNATEPVILYHGMCVWWGQFCQAHTPTKRGFGIVFAESATKGPLL
jgi:hypothetical protein